MKLKILIILLIWTTIHAETVIKRNIDVRNAQKGVGYIKWQEKKKVKNVKLKKYFLAMTRKTPFIFTSNDVVYELYLAAFLQKARPLWLENDKFVFHTSSNKNYLNRMKKIYERKYNIKLTVYKNTYFWKTRFNLHEVDRLDLIEYVNENILEYRISKKEKRKKKQIKAKGTKVNPAKIRNKREVRLVKKSSKYLQRHKKDRQSKLNRYVLYKEVKYPFIFFSHKPIYNLYLTGILNGGQPKWLADTKFIFHTSSSRKYLKRLQNKYKKKYNLDLTLSKNSSYKTKKFELMSVDNEDIIEYIQDQIPKRYKSKIKSVPKYKAKKESTQKDLKPTIKRNIDIRNAQKGVGYIKWQEKKKVKNVKLKKYFLAMTRKTPFIFTSNDVVYELYLAAFLQKARPLWLENDKFVFHTSSNKNYLNRMKKIYERKYNIKLTVYKNTYFWKTRFNLHEVDRLDLIEYINGNILDYLVSNQK